MYRYIFISMTTDMDDIYWYRYRNRYTFFFSHSPFTSFVFIILELHNICHSSNHLRRIQQIRREEIERKTCCLALYTKHVNVDNIYMIHILTTEGYTNMSIISLQWDSFRVANVPWNFLIFLMLVVKVKLKVALNVRRIFVSRLRFPG